MPVKIFPLSPEDASTLLAGYASAEHFLRSRSEATESGCWVTDSKRYACIRVCGRTHRLHRVSWTLVNGLIPEGRYICHKCNNKRCINPNHLYAGTPSDNMRDSWRDGCQPREGRLPQGRTLENSLMTHCHRGHPLTGQNLKFRNRSSRECRACHNIANAAYKARKRGQKNG